LRSEVLGRGLNGDDREKIDDNRQPLAKTIAEPTERHRFALLFLSQETFRRQETNAAGDRIRSTTSQFWQVNYDRSRSATLCRIAHNPAELTEGSEMPANVAFIMRAGSVLFRSAIASGMSDHCWQR
jgi:hypothetical protein